MNTHLLTLGLIASATFAPAALAGSAGVAQQNAINRQHNSGYVELAPSGGTQINNNVNNAYSSTFGFGPGISCPTPSLAVSAHGGMAGGVGGFSSGAYGASVSFIMPFGGETGEACRKLAAEIANQRVLDTQVGIIKTCAELARNGVKINPKDFPQFAACASVTVGGQSAIN